MTTKSSRLWCEIKEVGEDGVVSRFVPVEELFAGRHFDGEIVVLCVRWYLSFKLSYRDLVSMMSERGIGLAHTTILRWVQHYTPEFEKRWQRYARPVGGFSFGPKTELIFFSRDSESSYRMIAKLPIRPGSLWSLVNRSFP